jgi:ABC-type sulfate/molybdate transport systems ATPase subunit
MPTVKLENLTKRFDDIIALDGINLDIHDQEFFVLLGQTGAGKTTTLRCIAGLDLPENGAIYLGCQWNLRCQWNLMTTELSSTYPEPEGLKSQKPINA